MNAEIIVNTLLEQALKKGRTMTHIQIQKMLYFLHGYYLAETEKPLIDEPFEAWKYGPVVRNIYSHLSEYGDTPIRKYLPLFDKISGEKTIYTLAENDSEFWHIFNKVWEEYGQLSAFDLVRRSHEFDGPWDKVKINYGVISNESIKEYFQNVLKKG